MVTEEQLRERLALEAEQETQVAVARRYGVSQPFIAKVLAGGRIPPKLSESMGFRRIVRFERINGS